MASLSSVRKGVALAVNLLCDAYMLGNAVDAYIQARERDDDNTMLETASVVNALALVGFSIAEIGALLSGQKSESLEKLKKMELLPRVLNLPLQFALGVNELAIKAETDAIESSDIIQLMKKGVVAPIADIGRTVVSRLAYYEQHFLDMSPDQLKEARRPLYKNIFDLDDKKTQVKIVGYRPVNLEECKKNLAKLHIMFQAATVVRVAMQGKITEMVVSDLALPTMQRLAAFLGLLRSQPPGEFERDGRDRTRDGAALDGAEKELDLNLLSYPNIPEPLHGDQIFRQYICPITQRPIRDPVRDPTNGMTLYERRAIVTWIQHNPISPLTRMPLRTRDLQEAPVVRNQINRRLQQYQEELQRFLDMQASTPARD